MDAQAAKNPDVWTGLSFEIDEISMGANIVQRKMVDFTSSRAVIVGAAQERHLVNLKLAAERMAESAKTISIISGQVASLSEHLAKTIAKLSARQGSGRE